MQNPHGLADSRIIFPFRNPILRDIKIPIQESNPLRRFLHSIFQIPIPNSQHWHSNSQSKSCIEGGLRTLVLTLVPLLFESGLTIDTILGHVLAFPSLGAFTLGVGNVFRATETVQLLNALKYIAANMTESTGRQFSAFQYLPVSLKLAGACLSAGLGPPVLFLFGVLLPTIPTSMHNAQFLKYLVGQSEWNLLALQVALTPIELFLHVYCVISMILGGCTFIVSIGTLTAYSEGMRYLPLLIVLD